MNIAIYDLQHYEMVNCLLHIFEDYSITLITNNSIKNKIKCSEINNLSINFLINENFENDISFSQYCSEFIIKNKIDILILNTIEEPYKQTYNIIKKINIPIYTTLHNVNTWLCPPFTLNKLAIKNYYYRWLIKRKTVSYIVLEKSIKDYILSKKLTRKEVFIIPYSIYINRMNNYNHDNNLNKKIKIAIPGGIDGHRRDLNIILDIIKEINTYNIEFYFLGAVLGELGKKIYQEIIQLKHCGKNLFHYYDDKSNQLFEEKMNQCDIILSPIIVNTKFEGINEIYGKTKATGVIFDIIRFQKPAILPFELHTSEEINTCIIKYKSKEQLKKILLELSKNQSYLQNLKDQAVKCSINFSKEKVKHKIISKFKIESVYA